jgi:hypothetical protein
MSASRPRLERALPQIVAPETQKVEGDERGHEPAALRQETDEVAPSVVPEDDRFAVDQRLGCS